MPRKLNDWLQNYLFYTSGQESPERFHQWSGLSVLAATIERFCPIDRGIYVIYPNLYVILVAGSAIARKSTAVEIATLLCREANPDMYFVAQKISTERLISNAGTKFKDTKASAFFITCDEAASFFGKSAVESGMVSFLTKVYGCPKYYDYDTLKRGIEIVNNVCPNILGSTTPDWFKEAFPISSIAGGFTGRIVFVYCDGAGRLIAEPKLTSEQIAVRTLLIEDLREIRKLRGQFIMTPSGKEWFRIWYEDTFGKFVEHASPLLKGYFGRKHDSVMKIAALLSLSRGNTLEIDDEDLKRALALLNANEIFLTKVMEGIQTTEVGDENNKLISLIERKRLITYSDILRSLSYCMSAKTIQERLAGLVASKQVIEKTNGRGTSYEIGRIKGSEES